jgi:hypothetical protein
VLELLILVTQVRFLHEAIIIMEKYKQLVTQIKVALSTFEVECVHRNWNPLPGQPPPKGTVWEAHTDYLNRRVIAIGNSKKDVLKNLERHLRYYMERGF